MQDVKMIEGRLIEILGFFEKLFDKSKGAYYTATNQTVEAEITVIMIPQRARVAESRVKHRLSNGPRRVQSNETETIDMM